MRRLAPTLLALGTGLALGACATPQAVLPLARLAAPREVRETEAHPKVAVLAREGDPRGAIAIAVVTAGIDDAAPVAAVLAATTEERLRRAGLQHVTVHVAPDGYRVRLYLPVEGDASRAVQALRDALVRPLVDPADLDAASQAAARLAGPPPAELTPADPFGCSAPRGALDPRLAPLTLPLLERWRAASHGLGRVAFGVVGRPSQAEAVTSAILGDASWPAAAPRAVASAVPVEDGRAHARVIDGGAGVAGGAARLTLTLRTSTPWRAVQAATDLTASESTLARRLRTFDPALTLRDVAATVGANGGCLLVTLETPRVDARTDDVAAATYGVVDEMQRAVDGVVAAESDGDSPFRRANAATDPGDAAELAAWWALLGSPQASRAPVGSEGVVVAVSGANDARGDVSGRLGMLAAAFDRAAQARDSRVIESRVAVERGQAAISLLLASPCGTLDEGESDAGLGVLTVAALADQARTREPSGDVEFFESFGPDALGLVARVTRRPGEAPEALARRAADALGMAFVDTPGEGSIARARAALATHLETDASRAFAQLAGALLPGHPSWVFPAAPGRSLDGFTDGAVVARASALRRGSLRLAVLANEDATQADVAARALDRWLPRGASPRACPPRPPSPAPRPGTYGLTSGALTSAWLALPLSRGPVKDHGDAGDAVAAALDGPDGLLTRALSSGLASDVWARVEGPPGARFLVVQIRALPGSLDAAVAQTRALFDRLRRGALTEADRARAATRLESIEMQAALDPKVRLERLFHGRSAAAIPPLEALRASLADVMIDDALVIVASRPPLVKSAP